MHALHRGEEDTLRMQAQQTKLCSYSAFFIGFLILLKVWWTRNSVLWTTKNSYSIAFSSVFIFLRCSTATYYYIRVETVDLVSPSFKRNWKGGLMSTSLINMPERSALCWAPCMYLWFLLLFFFSLKLKPPFVWWRMSPVIKNYGIMKLNDIK